MRVKVIIVAAVIVSIFSLTEGYSIDQTKPRNISPDDGRYSTPFTQPANFKTDALINQQSENIHHIIAAEQRNHELQQRNRPDGLKQTKKEKAIVAIEDERFPTLEELRAKCQHFSRLFGLSEIGSGSVETSANSDISEKQSSTISPLRRDFYNRPMIEVTRRPVYIRNKPTFIEKSSGGFYVTTSSAGTDISSTKKPTWVSSTTYPRVSYTPTTGYTTRYTTTPTQSTTTRTTTPLVSTLKTENTHRPKIKIKYTKFEPVILQKTILTDGRVMYHWHRSIPTSAIDIPASVAPIAAPILQPSTYEYPPMPISQRNLGPIEPSTEEHSTTTTTTTEKSSWLFVPFSSLFGGPHDEETTTVESITAPPSTTTRAPVTKKEIQTTLKPVATQSSTEDAKQAQLKLVVPVHYDDIDASLSPNNRLGYYRKNTNAEAPLPSLQMIKTLGVPQNIPRYSLGYTGTGYGLTPYNGLPYSGTYSPEYVNYQAYSNIPLEREDKKLDDITV